jgi:GNAT superfamily N-acetyltransferase
MTVDGLAFEASGVEPPKLQAYAGLLAEVFEPSAKFAADAVGWRYRDNPAGQVVGTDAWAGERLAAHYVTCPVRARVEGRTVTGLLSLNTATHPDFQGRGLFTRLAEATYERGAAAGYGFVIGVANANSTPGFERKLGFQRVARLAAGMLLRRPRRFADAAPQYEADWSGDLLAWRLANPATGYHAARSGQLTGVWARTHLPFVRCAAFLAGVEPGAPVAARPPLAASLFIGLEPRLSLSGLGFMPIPERLRPSPLNLIWRRLDSALPAALDPAAVALNFLDFDPY